MKEVPVQVLPPLIIFTEKTGENIFVVLREEGGLRTCYMNLIKHTAFILSALHNNQSLSWPTPHSVALTILNKAGASLKKVVINGLVEDASGCYYTSLLHIENSDGSSEELPATPPDAIIFALMQKCPVLVADELLELHEDLNASLDEAATRNAMEKTSGNLSDQDALNILRNFDERGKPKN